MQCYVVNGAANGRAARPYSLGDELSCFEAGKESHHRRGAGSVRGENFHWISARRSDFDNAAGPPTSRARRRHTAHSPDGSNRATAINSQSPFRVPLLRNDGGKTSRARLSGNLARPPIFLFIIFIFDFIYVFSELLGIILFLGSDVETPGQFLAVRFGSSQLGSRTPDESTRPASTRFPPPPSPPPPLQTCFFFSPRYLLARRAHGSRGFSERAACYRRFDDRSSYRAL